MPRTYFTSCNSEVAPGNPWGVRAHPTGDPIDGTNQFSLCVLSGVPVEDNTFAVNDGTNDYSYTVLAGDDLAACAAGLSTALNGGPYHAYADGANVYVSGTTFGVGFTLTDTSVNTVTPGGTIAITTITPAVAGPLKLGDPGVIDLGGYRSVAIWAQKFAGTRFHAYAWLYDINTNLWFNSADDNVNVAVLLSQPNVAAVRGMFVEMRNFAGNASGTVTITGVKTAPGYNS